jgi:V-type H+-transporting ATPase subunit d
MIDNVILLLTGTLHERDTRELLEKCHPLGKFQSLATLAITTNPKDAYKLVLVDTPLAPYAQKNFSESQDFTELNIEIIRNTLYKAYLEDFYAYTQTLGGATAEVQSMFLSCSHARFSLCFYFCLVLCMSLKKKILVKFTHVCLWLAVRRKKTYCKR